MGWGVGGMEELLLWDKRILVFSTTGMVAKAQGPGQTLSPSFGAWGKADSARVLIPWTTGFSKGLQSGRLLPLPSHPSLEDVQRQDRGGTRKEREVI